MEATVKSCVKVKEWNNKPIYSVEFSDGSKGNSFGAEIPVGTAKSDLTITPKEGYPDDVKMKRNGFAGGGRPAQKPNNAAFSIAYAKDLVVADKVKIDQLIPTAEKIFQWIESKNK